MEKKSKLLNLAVAGAIVAGGAVNTTEAHAGGYYCKGISMKWVNGCAANGHQCEFKAKTDWDKNEWLSVKNEADCKAIKTALKNPAIKKYVEKIRDTTVVAVKRGKKY